MKDSFGREIDYIRISVTDRCNLRCSYCMPKRGIQLAPSEEILTFEEIVWICLPRSLESGNLRLPEVSL